VAGGHSHSHREQDQVRVGSRARSLLLGILAVAAVATVVGLFQLWPEAKAVDAAGGDVQFSAPGVTFPHATITKVLPSCDPGSSESGQAASDATCGQLSATVSDGVDDGLKVKVPLVGPMADAGLSNGDSVQLMRVPPSKGAPAQYSFFGVDRTSSLALMAGLFVLVVLAVARLRGLMAILGLGFSGLVLVKFMLPALLAGESGLAVALVGAAAIMFVVLYAAHGPSVRTSTALAGTLVGIAITAAIAQVAVGGNRLSGVGDEASGMLSSLVGDLRFQGLLTCAIIVAGLGVLNDVTITQSSAVWELRAAGPDLSRRQLFSSAMRIGRDHIASTIYTIVFAYTGAALSVLLVLFLYDRPVLDLLGTEDIAAEVVRTLASAIGLVLAVPVTTAIAAFTVASGTVTAPRKH
jgi:uncharacterized membrane protein